MNFFISVNVLKWSVSMRSEEKRMQCTDILPVEISLGPKEIKIAILDPPLLRVHAIVLLHLVAIVSILVLALPLLFPLLSPRSA